MNIPFIDLKAQYPQCLAQIEERLGDIIANTGFILGPYVEDFERRFAAAHGADYCIGVSSGTDALHVALLALGIGPGDGVLLPVNTFIATAEAVSLVGATPLFVDCDGYSNIDVNKVRDILETSESNRVKNPQSRKQESQCSRAGDQGTGGQNRKKQPATGYERSAPATAIIPVHLYGQPANMDEIMALAEAYDLHVVEDASQAHLARYRDRNVGNFGAFGTFSFYPGKNLGAFGEAGALLTNDEGLYRTAKMLRQHGEVERYHHQVVGHNYRMEAIQGAVLGVKLNYLDEWSQKRRTHARLYNELLSGIDGVETPEELDGTSCVYHLYVIQAEDRNGLKTYLAENGVATAIHYPIPLHRQNAYAHLRHQPGDFPMAERAADRILSLPMYPELTEEQIGYVCKKIAEFRIQNSEYT